MTLRPYSARIALALILAFAAKASISHAEGRTSALNWVRLPGAEQCIGAPALAAAVEERLGRRVFVPPSDAEISVEGSIAYRAESKRATAKFRVADRTGKVLGARDIDETVSSCDKLDERLAFVLSVLVDPDAALAPAPAPSTPASPPPPPSPPPAVPLVERPPPKVAPNDPWRWMVGAGFGGAGGLLPGIGWVFSAGGLVTPPGWPGIHLEASSFFPTSQRLVGGTRAEVELVTGELGVCPLQLRRSPFGLNACVDALAGSLGARGSGFPDSRRYQSLVGAGVLSVIAELSLTPLVLMTLSPKVVVPLTRSRLTYLDEESASRTIFEVSPVAASLVLGLAVGSREEKR